MRRGDLLRKWIEAEQRATQAQSHARKLATSPASQEKRQAWKEATRLAQEADFLFRMVKRANAPAPGLASERRSPD
jgi:hypothetical protein